MFKIHCSACDGDLFCWHGEISEWVCIECHPESDRTAETLWRRESFDYGRERVALKIAKAIVDLQGEVGCTHFQDWGILGGM